jgi:hypothetical protein
MENGQRRHDLRIGLGGTYEKIERVPTDLHRSSLDDVCALPEARFQEKSVHEHGAPARVR